MKKIISLIIVCTIIISGMFIYGKSDKKDLLEDNNGPIIAAVIDGKASTTFPTTNKYTATVECTRNGIKQDVGAKAIWNGTKWVVSFNGISAGNVRCNAIFTTRFPTFSETILANNEVKAPILHQEQQYLLLVRHYLHLQKMIMEHRTTLEEL